jgi:zinc finger protein
MLDESKQRWEKFFANLTDAIEGKREFTLILEDPLAGSYVQSLTAPEPDPKLDIVDYVRTDEEEEDLGLRDIRTEGYEEDAENERLERVAAAADAAAEEKREETKQEA